MRWRCMICGYIHDGKEPPFRCPMCGAPAKVFELLNTPELEPEALE